MALKSLRSLIRTLFRGRELDRDLDEELRAYLDHQIAAEVAKGVGPAEARRRVLADEGGLEPIKEGTRAARIGFAFATVLQDLRYGIRSMRRSPGYAAVACLTLALGIGANIAMFTVMRSVLWRPLPYADADRLVVVETDIQGLGNAGATPADVHDFRARSRTLEMIATVNEVDAHVAAEGDIEHVAAVSASDNLLPLLGVTPAIGRHLDLRLDMGPDAVRAVVISDGLWRRRLAADPSVIGRIVDINNLPVAVVGVLPAGFKLFLPASIGTSEDIDVWFPAELPATREFRGYSVVARLAPGRTPGEAAIEIDAIRKSVAVETGVSADGVITRVRHLREAMTAGAASGLTALGFAVMFVLLVSCVNVANLMLARASGRVRELAVRRALGAGRARIVRQLLTESLLLSVVAGTLGLVLAVAGLELLDWLRPVHLPRRSQVSMDAGVWWYSAGVSLAAGAIFGVLPSLRFAAQDTQALRAGRAESAGRGSRRLQRALVVAEIALSIVPLVAAGLLLRSFVNLSNAPLGFQPQGVLTAKMPISFRRFPYPNTDARVRLHVTALQRLEELPGVEAVSAASPMPFAPVQMTRRFGRADRPGNLALRPLATQQSIMPGYLSLTGTRLVQGRDFTRDDLAAKRPVVIVDMRLASALWPEGALGRHLLVGASRTPLEIVGITEPVRVQKVRDAGQPHIFVPYHVFPIEMTLVLKTAAPAAAMAPAIKKVIGGLGTGRAVHDVKPLSAFVRDSIADTRFTMLVLGGFAITALLLAAIGLYGTLAYLASQRAREFGVRLALGASRRQILTLVAGEGLVLTAIGAVLGLAGSFAAARALRGLLYGVEPLDPSTLLAVTGLVCLLAAAACLKPAWSAAQVDPTTALRAD